MKKDQIYFVILLLIVFVIGAYVYAAPCMYLKSMQIETLQNRRVKPAKCPNVLVKRGDSIYMYNTTDRNDAVPIRFQNLDEYAEYVKMQQAQGKNCPILFLQEETDVQGNDVYRLRPSPFDLQGGMTPVEIKRKFGDITAKEFNSDGYHGFDPTGQNQGIYTILDAVHDSTAKQKISANPMDPNWGGVEYTQDLIEEGVYKDREVTKPVYFSPKGQFIPGLGNRIPPQSVISSSGTKI